MTISNVKVIVNKKAFLSPDVKEAPSVCLRAGKNKRFAIFSDLVFLRTD